MLNSNNIYFKSKFKIYLNRKSSKKIFRHYSQHLCPREQAYHQVISILSIKGKIYRPYILLTIHYQQKMK
jgi:hypothetical protein